MSRYTAFRQERIPYRWRNSRRLTMALSGVRNRAAKLRTLVCGTEVEALLTSTARLESIAGSAQLEGNPLDVADTRAILAGETLPAPFDVQPEHRLDIVNHDLALAYSESRSRSSEKVSLTDLGEIQSRLMTGLLPEESLGRLRAIPMATYFVETGEKIADCPGPDALDALMTELSHWLEESRDPCLRAIGFQFLAREIHPFTAGNRRSARLMQRLLLLEQDEREIASLSSWEWTVACDAEFRFALPRVVMQAREMMTLEPFFLFMLESMESALERATAEAAALSLVQATERRTLVEQEAAAARSRITREKRPKGDRPTPRQKDLD